MATVWKTKYGTRRVRHDPPTLKEAIIAARGLTDELQQQAEIAAALMDLPVETGAAAQQYPNRDRKRARRGGKDGDRRTQAEPPARCRDRSRQGWIGQKARSRSDGARR